MIEPISDTPLIYKRTVVLLPGFDPRGASYYHKMLSKQFEKYGNREALNIDISLRKRLNKHWHSWNIVTQKSRISFFYAEWDDIVRKDWHRSRFRLFLDSCRTYKKYLSSFYLLRCSISTSYSQVGFYYPVVSFLLLYSLLISGMAIAVWHITKTYDLSILVTVICFFVSALCALLLGHKITPYLNGGWLLRIFCFTKKTGCEGAPEWERRVPTFAGDLAQKLSEDPPDELLVVGHSVGTIMAIYFLKELLNCGSFSGRISYMGMGQCVQLVSFLQNDKGKFNQVLREVAESPRVSWVDFTMPSDGACIALQDPMRASLQKPPNYPNPDSPKFISPRFMEGYTKQRFKELKRDSFEYHFQYYMTPDKAAEFEFAAIVLEDMSLAKRFANRENQARNR